MDGVNDYPIAPVLPHGTKIEVTDHDIANGSGDSPTSCPIALAVRRLLPDGCFPHVVADWMEIFSRGGQTIQRIELPWEVGEWVRQFDEWMEYDECTTDEEIDQFWEEHNDGEPYEICAVEPMRFEIPA